MTPHDEPDDDCGPDDAYAPGDPVIDLDDPADLERAVDYRTAAEAAGRVGGLNLLEFYRKVGGHG